MAPQLVQLAAAVAAVPDGAAVALGRPAAMALVRELARQQRRDLRLIGVPTGGQAVEALIAAGCARSLESSGVDLGEEGLAPAFSVAVERGELEMLEHSCPAMLLALQAAASGLSFTPVPGLIGSDLLGRRPDFQVVADPFRPGGEVVLVPALRPEFAILHGRRADPDGNVVIGNLFDDRLIAQAARHVVVSVDEVETASGCPLARDEQLIPAAYIDALVLVRH